MIKYIIEILKIQSSVILPGFGSLQVANTKTGKIVFNSLLKFNDGTLAKYIAEKEGIDQQAAQNQVAKFIREIDAEISKGNSFDMFQFGKFQKNKKGEVEFLQEGTPVQPTGDTKPAPVVKDTKPTEEKSAKKTEEEPAETNPGKPAEKKAEKPAEKQAEPKSAKKPETKAEEKPAAKKAEVKPGEKIKEESKAEPAKPVEAKKAEPKTEVKKEAPKVEKPADKKPQDLVKKPGDQKAELKPDPSPEVNKDTSLQPESESPKKHGVPDKKPAETSAEATPPKQNKNTFTPKESGVSEASMDKEIDKPGVKIPEVAKNIPLAEATKKDPAAQEKNKFVPPVEGSTGASEKIEKLPDVPKAAPKVMAASVKDEKIVEETSNGTKEKFKKDKPQKVKNEVPKEKKKKSKWMRWLVLLLLVGGGATAGWFYQDEIRGFLYAGVGDDHDSTTTAVNHTDDSLSIQHTTDATDETLIDTTIAEEAIVEEPVTEEPVTEEPDPEPEPVQHTNNSSSGGNYHLIGNSFASKENAERYAGSMKDKGYSAKVLGKFDNLYLVSIKQFSSREDAKAGLSSVKSDAASAWVFKY